LFSGRLLRVRPSKKQAHARYLSYQFQGESFKQRIRGVAVGQTMASLNTMILKDAKVGLPPLPEQRAIARVL
jgi:type I restriction enzyme S subunit